MVRRGGYGGHGHRTTRGSGLKLRLLIAGAIVLFSLFSYFGQSDVNPITGKRQRVAMTEQEEIALGLRSAPQMAQSHGGLHANQEYQQIVDQVGLRLVRALNQHIQRLDGRTNPYQYEFHLLADDRTINAFALPGGQCFITFALFRELANYDRPTKYGEFLDRLAGVMAHEVGHVISRHGAQRMAKQKLTQGLVGAASVGGGSYESGRLAAAVAQMVNMKYGREDELEADLWGVSLADGAGFDARAMLDVMVILEESSGGAGPPEMMSTHPKPANRRAYITKVLRDAGVQIE